jgi:hypothetical protein
MHDQRKVKDIKRIILKKKILFNYLVDHYAFWARVYKYILNTFAICSILIGVITEIMNYQGSIIFIAINTITAALIKIREYLDFDKIKEVGKVQAIKYAQLYSKFEQGISQYRGSTHINEFLYWVSRELGIIEMGDPEINSKIRQNFIKICEKYGIKCEDDDLLMLKSLADQDTDATNSSIDSAFRENEQNKQEFKRMSVIYDNRAALKWALENLERL